MLGIARRFWNVLRGKTNRLLNRLENPEEQLAVFVSELNEQVRDLQRSVASAIADEKRLRMQIEERLSQGAGWGPSAYAGTHRIRALRVAGYLAWIMSCSAPCRRATSMATAALASMTS